MEECETFLMEYYETGRTIEGADACPPLLLLKCLLLQKWFRLRPTEASAPAGTPSDLELENQACHVEYMTLH